MGWETIDFVVWRGQTPPATTRGLVLPVLPAAWPSTGQVWRVEGVTVSCTQPVSTKVPPAYVYDVDPAAFLGGATVPPADGTRYGIDDVDDRHSPITIPGGGGCWIVWLGVDLGAVGSARVQWQLAQRTGAAAAQPVAF